MNHRVLVLCDDTWHPAATVRQGLEPLRQHGFDFEFLEDGAVWPLVPMEEFSLIVLAKANITSSVVNRPWLMKDSPAAFFDYVHGGNGLLVIHAGTSRYDQLPVMDDLIGGEFVSHPDPCAVTVEPEPGHPLAAGIRPFTVRDEHYFMEVDEPRVEIFLRSRSGHGVQPAGWTRTEGLGRVCVLTPGHNLEVWLHPSFQALLLNALRWMVKLN